MRSQLLVNRLVSGSGAGCSKGRTSWTSKAELADYTSFAGFLIHYLYYLEPRRLEPSTAPSPGGLEGHPLEPIASALPLAIEPTSFPFDSNSEPLTTLANDEKTLLILGGYSYGSLIATRLPPTPSIITSTTNGDVSGSPQSEILLRAHHCAAEWNREAAMPSASPLKTENGSRRRSGAYQPHHHSPRGVVIGGEEGEPGRRKPSREFRRSLEIGRLSVELPVIPSPSKRKSADLRRRSYHFSPDNSLSSSTSPSRVPGLPSPTPHSIQTAYLLISPLLPPISHLATFSFFSPSQKPTTTTTLTTNPTLAIYGTHDVFTSPGKLKRWAEEMAAEAGRGGGVGGGGRGQFRNVAVEGAGHFWVEEKVLEGGLRGEIGLWVDDLMVD
jgi:hypothetical protein